LIPRRRYPEGNLVIVARIADHCLELRACPRGKGGANGSILCSLGLARNGRLFALFHALSLGPANVPIYGMFVVGGSLLGVLVLGEPMVWHKVAGLPPP